MTNHFLVIETADNKLTVKTLMTASVQNPEANAMATELLDFLAIAAKVWLEMRNVQNLTTKH